MNFKLTLLLVTLSVVLFDGVSRACDAHRDAVVSTDTNDIDVNNTPSLVSTRKAYLNPETLEFSPADQSSIAIEQFNNVDVEGKENSQEGSEQAGLNGVGVASAPQRMSDGSLKIDFNGQFDRPLKASIGVSGEVKVNHHLHSPSESTDSQLNH